MCLFYSVLSKKHYLFCCPKTHMLWQELKRQFCITFVASIGGRKMERRGLTTIKNSLKISREERNGCKQTLLLSIHCQTTYLTRTCWKTSNTWLSSNIQVLYVWWSHLVDHLHKFVFRLKIIFSALPKTTCWYPCFRELHSCHWKFLLCKCLWYKQWRHKINI